MTQAGVLIAFEGIDGSGKGTQARLLQERCESEGISCSTIGFPQYGRTPFAEAISEYLNGAFGGVSEVHPKLVSILFAADRFAARESILREMGEREVLICDRYVASNMAHQGAKLAESEQKSFIRWLEVIEYQVFDLPQAALTIYLDMPAQMAQDLVHKKPSREVGSTHGSQGGYTSLKTDIHEADLDYLESCRKVYDRLSEQGVGGRWVSIPSVNEYGIRTAEEIAQEIWSATMPLIHRSSG